jgi:hypothetical protein
MLKFLHAAPTLFDFAPKLNTAKTDIEKILIKILSTTSINEAERMV